MEFDDDFSDFDDDFDDDYNVDHSNDDAELDDDIRFLLAMEPFDNTGGGKDGSNGGCYIATCVYGSYDCPEVWTLRRFRDLRLAQTRLGRLFIHVYYAISPTVVSLFGNRSGFRHFWRKVLDSMVLKLKSEGMSDEPYQDIG